MSVNIRMLPVVLSALFRKKNIRLQEEAKIKIVLMPWDCLTQPAGNSHYHGFLNLACADLVIRLGWLRFMIVDKWRPRVLSWHIRYQQPLYVLDKVFIYSYIIASTAKYIWVGYRIECKSQIVCTAIAKLPAISRNSIPRGNFTHHFTPATIGVFSQADASLGTI